MTASSGDPLSAARPDERWVVRFRLPDGSATDLIGWVDALTPTAVELSTADQTRRSVARPAVLAARRVPAAAGAPHPRRVSPAELQRRALPGWRAYAEPLGEWTLRAGGGFTGRANSCLALGDPGRPVPQAAERIIAYARDHGITPMAMVVTGSAEEQALRAIGWADTYVPSEVLAARLADFLSDRGVPAGVRVTEDFKPAWLDAYHRSRPNDADPEVLRMILGGNPPRAFGSAQADGEIFAITRGHLSGLWLGLASIWTDPEHRRRGWATKVMTALAHWAARRGARYAYLQVDAANPPAIATCARLGFVRHHGYLYLAPQPRPR